ncbi:MAG: DNA polymerase I [Clostridia bacterium]|nr:DNA polymerase I [Clostridia bacterium]
MKLMAIDGNSLINRAFYALTQLTSPDGTPTGAVHGFFTMLLKLMEERKPDGVCVCFDVKAKTFRHLEYEGYKAQRKPMPEELAVQIPIIKELLDLMGIARMEQEGYEADDLLGTLARTAAEAGDSCEIVTGDRDSLQFIAQGARVSLLITKQGQTTTETYDEALFAEKYAGLSSDKIVDLKAIMGDSSDNIPGVRGIGEKGAMELLTRFGSLDGVYENIDDPRISASVRRKLEEGRDMAYLSYRLATGETHVPIACGIEELKLKQRQDGELYNRLEKLGLRALIKKMELHPSAEAPPERVFEAYPVQRLSEAEAVRALAGKLRGRVAVCFSRDGELCAVSCGGRSWVFSREDAGEAAFAEILARLFGGETELVMHDARPVFAALDSSPRLAFDTAVAAYLLDPTGGNYDMERVAQRYLGCAAEESIYDGEDARNLFGYSEEAVRAIAQHSAMCLELCGVLEEALEKSGMKQLYCDIELPLVAVLADMQREGMGLDSAHLLRFGGELGGEIAELERRIYELAGEPFNIGSPKQLGAVLFEKLGLHALKKTKSGYSTDAEVLKKLADKHEIVPCVLRWRELTKLRSTYVEGLIKAVGEDGRIHASFNQMVTATGRLSCTEPNLQNIPVRRELGSEVRKCFVPREGWVFAGADYSQIELRILAHISGDESMLGAFRRGEDIHTATAAQVFGVPFEEVTPQMRSGAKAVNFGIVYGISAFSLADDIKVTTKEAQAYIDAYLEKYHGVREYMESIKRKAREDGFVTTVYGRRRYLPELRSSNFNVRSFGERVALNTPIQGTAADIIKIAMLRVTEAIRREGLRARLVLQVHDELICECPRAEAETVCALLRREMEGAAQLSVPLTADAGYGENWYDAKK